MPIKPTPDRSRIPGRSSIVSALQFAPAEWDLLVRLPRRVLLAAASIHDTTRHTVAEGLAGIEAIAAGRTSPSRLVRDIVAAIYAEPDDDLPGPEELTDPPARVAGVLAECRAAGWLLADRTPAADAAAYRGWLSDVAMTVCAAARPFGLGGRTPVSPAERMFLDELAAALGVP
jgi:hypothetical protein